MVVCYAVLNFNSGYRSLFEIFEKMYMNNGHYTTAYCVKKNTTRIHKMERKMSTEGKYDRKRKRAVRKWFQDKHKETEGEVYESGQF